MMKPKKNPITKIIGAGVKAAAKAAGAKPSLKAAQKAKPLATPKSGVRVKSAAKQKPNKPNESKYIYKVNETRNRAYNKAVKEYESMPEAGRFGSAAEKDGMASEASNSARISRKMSIASKKYKAPEASGATTPKRRPEYPARTTVKINSAKSVRLRKVSPKKKK
jgi:hypothetical protein